MKIPNWIKKLWKLFDVGRWNWKTKLSNYTWIRDVQLLCKFSIQSSRWIWFNESRSVGHFLFIIQHQIIFLIFNSLGYFQLIFYLFFKYYFIFSIFISFFCLLYALLIYFRIDYFMIWWILINIIFYSISHQMFLYIRYFAHQIWHQWKEVE